MNGDDIKRLNNDPDGLLNYEYLANHIDTIAEDIDQVVNNLITVDRTGQFTASAARYLHTIDRMAFKPQVDELVEATIGKDREHRYLADLLVSIYGADYAERATELSATDNNFRRIYKRLFPNPNTL